MKIRPILIVASLLLMVASPALAGAGNQESIRKEANSLRQEGNYKDAYELYVRLMDDEMTDPMKVESDLNQAVGCIRKLGRVQDSDALVEKAVRLHGNNWRLLHRAAEIYFSQDHRGFLISGEFERGGHRGGGQYVNALARDRVRALQLMKQALDILPADENKDDVSSFCFRFAAMIFEYQSPGEHWRLQYTTDLSVLPDYEEGFKYFINNKYMPPPVDEKGNPIFYYPPPSFEQAANDGERYRWLLDYAAKINPKAKNEAMWNQAMFLYWQFGVQTMADSFVIHGPAHEDEVGEGPFSVQTLSEDETMASLATGIKRFALPEGQNHITLFKRIAETGGNYSKNALEMLAHVFKDRRQYPKAVQYTKELIKRFPDIRERQENELEQLTGAMGRFYSTPAQPAGKEVEVGFVFRNGKTVHFKAEKIKLQQYLENEKDFFRKTKDRADWYRSNSHELLANLTNTEKSPYLSGTVAEWDLALEPLPDHFDKRIMVKTPLIRTGVYLLTAEMEKGYSFSTLIWIMDTALAKKSMDGREMFFAADAATGEPLEGMKVDLFGYRWDSRQHRYDIMQLEKMTDRNGLAFHTDSINEDQYQWIVSASDGDGRFAYFTPNINWNSNANQEDLNRTRAFGITDRPVYRPGQTVHYKFWVRQARYDLGEKSMAAGKSFMIKGADPQSADIINETKVADEYGGVEGTYTLPEDAPLGMYSIRVDSREQVLFRVEEYKKPEFEVTVKAPEEPIALGDKIPVEIQASYYFGGPVTGAKVSYKVLRSEYSRDWFPRGAWDWLYGAGYWWFAYDYDWYPGWVKWGCPRPHWSWWWHGSNLPPEVVAQGQGLTDENGVLKLSIDTALAKELRGNSDHRYEITMEVTDQSRRTIVGKGSVIAAREPFKVYAWVNKGHYQVGDVVSANFSTQTPDGKPVPGKGKVVLYKVTRANGKPVETAVKEWDVLLRQDGRAALKMDASQAGQYRLSLSVTDSKGRTQEGGYLFCVMGDKDTGRDFVFDHLELVPDLREYAPGDKVRLRINTRAKDSTVLLFVRPQNGVYPRPQILRINGNSTIQDIEVSKKDMPNFFVEAMTIHDGKVYSEVRQIVVPPEKRVFNVEVLPSSEKYKPGEKAIVDLSLTDVEGKPYKGTTVLTVYDKAVEYISGGSNVPDIRDFFWKWVRRHYPETVHSLEKGGANIVHLKFMSMQPLGVFGNLPSPEEDGALTNAPKGGGTRAVAFKLAPVRYSSADPEPIKSKTTGVAMMAEASSASAAEPQEENVHVRTEFADTAFWAGSLETDANGHAQVEFTMPENLTAWKIKAWAMGHGTRVGQGEAEVATSKDLLLRLQAPRFFVEGDEVVLSANIHNYLDDRVMVRAVLELDGECLDFAGSGASKLLPVDAKGEERVDWRVKVVKEGEAIVRMKALTGEESDAMEMRFPVYVHGMEKTETYSGVIRPSQNTASFTVDVPEKRRPEATRLEVRYSPSLAGAMVDALPYLSDYPYGCTEQTLNRFLPTVITLNLLQSQGIDLGKLKEKHTNLNAQEMGDAANRAAQWKHWDENPVYDPAKVRDMAREGIKKLASMQNSDGGWGWFSGRGEYSYPHTTATVVRGLLKAREAGADVPAEMINQGITWLNAYEDQQLLRLKNAEIKANPYKTRADNVDAYVFMILAQAGQGDADMEAFLVRDKNDLSVYGLTLLGMGLHAMEHTEDLARVLKNIEQYLRCDDENQTCYLDMGNQGYWWTWYGDEMEAHAWYLKLLALTGFEGRSNDPEPMKDRAAGLVKYILNNRKHAARWNSTRDTALCIEALADYLNASGEDTPDMKIAVFVDGKLEKEVAVNQSNMFDFDNVFVMEGHGITAGKHEIRLERKGKGPVYFNGWMTNFTLEDDIKAAGLEIKVDRKVFRLTPVDKTIKDAGAHGQVLDRKVEKYARTELHNMDMLQSGDLVEVELTIQSKNDYEYVVFEDFKPAGFEPVEIRSGYGGNSMGAYTEYRDERVAFFCQSLARGTHSLAYRMRAEIPGRFSSLPTKAHAMYAPELRANSDEIKLQVED
ncbi:MAG: hypothetical protein JEZ02_03850 [Desulfatibacillum sp.]|nr:hypothetical protein [Desulfatibacillum sp.]